MKNTTLFFLLSLLTVSIVSLSTSCKKDEKIEIINQIFDTTGYTRVRTQEFVSDEHTTTGQLIIYADSANLVYVFKNFQTDKGPNLEVWLANSINNVQGGGYQNLGGLKSTQGEFYYIASSNTALYSYLVIWCVDFSVKFGHAPTI